MQEYPKNFCFVSQKADFTLMIINVWKFTLLIYTLHVFSEENDVNQNQLLWSWRSLSSIWFWLWFIKHPHLCKALYPTLAFMPNVEKGSRSSPEIFLHTRMHTFSNPCSVLLVTHCVFIDKWLLWNCYIWNKNLLKYSLPILLTFTNFGKVSLAVFVSTLLSTI